MTLKIINKLFSKDKILLLFILILPLSINSQKQETIDWITKNSIEIEDANPDSELINFNKNIPERFENAKIFGFGEASHNTQEFFNLKAKFFKYLVKTQGVRTFIMEESYQAEKGINEWISGGKGDVKTIAKNFNIGYWYTKEIVNLLEWMRNYNENKPIENQIRFYGMDIQVSKRINLEIREFIDANKITISEKILKIVDSCANKKINYSIKDNWWQQQLPVLNQLKKEILNSNQKDIAYHSVERSLDYLIKYTEYATKINLKYPESTKCRDLKMFENVKWIVENEAENGKAFIWAHNEHINKKEMYYTGSEIINLGRHLKDYYKDDYYSIGFDFGVGKIDGLTTNKKGGNRWEIHHIKKPFKKTYAYTLMSVNKNIYFIDLEKANKNGTANFFTKKNKHLLIAAGGYQPKPLHKIMINKVYADTYDALIFVKQISQPDYNLDR